MIIYILVIVNWVAVSMQLLHSLFHNIFSSPYYQQWIRISFPQYPCQNLLFGFWDENHLLGFWHDSPILGCGGISLWFIFAFRWVLINLRMFSCVSCPFVIHSLKICYSCPLPVCEQSHLFCCCWISWIYSG